MKKYEIIELLAPAYTDEYKEWLKKEGIPNPEDKQERVLQWISWALSHSQDYFPLPLAQQYGVIQRLAYFLLDQYRIEMPEHINDKHKDVIIWARTSLSQAKWEDQRRHNILTSEMEKECYELIDQLDPPIEEEVPEVSKEDESPGEVPEVSKVTKLEGVKRAKRKSDS